MKGKNAGWIIIGIAIVLGILRLTDVINDAVTGGLFIISVILLGGASKGFKKEKEEPAPPAEE
jgi:hypothetical protein